MNTTLLQTLADRLDAVAPDEAIGVYIDYLNRRSGSYIKLEALANSTFDHALAPASPVGTYRGHSTVSVAGKAIHYPGEDHHSPGTHPIGLGIRTPAVIVSPWARGGFVCSQLFDHTPVIRFLEQRLAWSNRISTPGADRSTATLRRRSTFPQRLTLQHALHCPELAMFVHGLPIPRLASR